MTHLRRLAGHLPSGDDRDLNRRFRNLLHYDDPARLAVLRDPRSAAPIEQLLLGYQLFHEATDMFGPAGWLGRLNADLSAELGELADAIAPRAHAVQSPRIHGDWPLHIPRRYERREIQTACADMTPQRRRSHREGILRLGDLRTELLFVTLDKSEGGFSPTPRAIATTRSAATTSTGRRRTRPRRTRPPAGDTSSRSGTAGASSSSSARRAGMPSSSSARCAT